MDRRTFLAGTGLVLLAAPLAAEGQRPGKVFRIGATVSTDAFYDAFLQRLGELGWVPGQNAVVERRTARGERAGVAATVAELADLATEPPQFLPLLCRETVRSFTGVEAGLLHPVPDRLGRGLELPPQFFRRPSLPNQFDDALSELRRVQPMVLGHRGGSLPPQP